MATEDLLPRRITAPSFPPHGSGAAAVFTPSSAYLHPIFRQVRSAHRTVTHVGTKQGRGPRAVEMVRHLCPGDRSGSALHVMLLLENLMRTLFVFNGLRSCHCRRALLGYHYPLGDGGHACSRRTPMNRGAAPQRYPRTVTQVDDETGQPKVRQDAVRWRARHARVEAPFVGRAHEFRQLLELLGAASQGQGQVVMISGPAGIGKTRLAEEMALRVRRRGVRVAVGRCWRDGE